MDLNLEHICYSRGDASFSYHAHISDPITGVFGYSGAGKTTLLNLIAGILTPDSGRLSFQGRVCFDREAGINIPGNRRHFGVVFQDSLLFPHLSVRNNLLFSKAARRSVSCRFRIEEIIDLLDLGDLLDRKPCQLSGGESKRVAIGRSLLSQPELLLMDEPFANLDRNRRVEIICYLRRICRELELPALVISHDLEDLLKLSRTLLVIQDGTIRKLGDFGDIAYPESLSLAGNQNPCPVLRYAAR